MPDAFLWITDEDFIWKKSEICNIPILQTAFVLDTMLEVPIPFIPVWEKYTGLSMILERVRFNNGYTDCLCLSPESRVF